MNGILNYIASRNLKARHSVFHPSSVPEFFALRLAQKLNDGRSAAHYVDILDQYTEDDWIAAFVEVKDQPAPERARLFHQALRLRRDHPRYQASATIHNLVAIRVERRSVAVVIAKGGHPEHTQVRQLSSTSEKAVASAYGFVNRIIEVFRPQSVAVERLSGSLEIQRAHINAAVLALLRERGIGVWEFSKRELFMGFGEPPLRSRLELRQVIGSIWPMLDGGYGALYVRDAAALALFCQAERVFNL